MIGRRRIAILLLLSAVLLLTLDLRGTSGLALIRSGFVQVMQPVETAAQVVSRPVINVWRSITTIDDLREENRRLQEQIDAQRGNEIAARNAIIENRQLLALNALESLTDIPSVTAGIIGGSPSNTDQVVEIDRGRRQGIQVGMAVANEAGLLGKVTSVFENSSLVMLLTDPRYAVEVKVLSGDRSDTGEPPVDSVPSGLPLEGLAESVEAEEAEASAAAEAVIEGVLPGAGEGEAAGDPVRLELVAAGATAAEIAELERVAAIDGRSLSELVLALGGADEAIVLARQLLQTDTDEPTASGVTDSEGSVTAVAEPDPTPDLPAVEEVLRETGALVGQGAGRLPQVNFVVSNPTLAALQVGDVVLTAGGRTSLAPPDIPVGTVVNIITRPGSAGSQLEIEPAADLSNLQFVRILLYKPSVEIGQ